MTPTVKLIYKAQGALYNLEPFFLLPSLLPITPINYNSVPFPACTATTSSTS